MGETSNDGRDCSQGYKQQRHARPRLLSRTQTVMKQCPAPIPTRARMRVLHESRRRTCCSPISRRSARWPSAADADELGVALCHELGCDAGADSAVTKVLADRLTCDAQQALRRCRSHSPSGHQPTPANLFPNGRDAAVAALSAGGLVGIGTAVVAVHGIRRQAGDPSRVNSTLCDGDLWLAV